MKRINYKLLSKIVFLLIINFVSHPEISVANEFLVYHVHAAAFYSGHDYKQEKLTSIPKFEDVKCSSYAIFSHKDIYVKKSNFKFDNSVISVFFIKTFLLNSNNFRAPPLYLA